VGLNAVPVALVFQRRKPMYELSLLDGYVGLWRNIQSDRFDVWECYNLARLQTTQQRSNLQLMHLLKTARRQGTSGKHQEELKSK
jgi:hypothetical protein